MRGWRGILIGAVIGLLLLPGKALFEALTTEEAGEQPPSTPSAVIPDWVVENPAAMGFDSREEAVDWLQTRNPGVIIENTTHDPFQRGHIRYGTARVALGETPPDYLFALATTIGPVLVSSESNRHGGVYAVSKLVGTGPEARLERLFDVRYDWRSTYKGFVLKRGEDLISQIGVLVPELFQAAADYPLASRWGDDSATIRLGPDEPGAERVSEEAILAAPRRLLHDDEIILLPFTQRHKRTYVKTTRYRIVWLRFNEAHGVTFAPEEPERAPEP